MNLEYQSHHPNGGVRRGRGEASLSNTSSDLNQSSSNSISLSHSLSNSHSQSNQHQQQQHYHTHQGDPMQSWWESVSKARSRIQALLNLLPPTSNNDSLSSLADSDRPARSVLDSYEAYSAISSSLSGSGDDPLCQWLYDTFLESSSDDSESDLRLVVMSLVPLIAGLYLSRIHSFSTTSPAALGSPSLAGFEAVLLALYSYETKARAGKPVLVSIPSPSYLNHHPSLYHTPTPQPSSHTNNNSHSRSSSSVPSVGSGGIVVGIISPPLEPQMGIKSTKRASIVGLAFHCFFKHISQMPSWSKIDLCRFAASWAGDDCPCALSLDFHSTAPNTTNQRDDDDDVVSVREELALSLTTFDTNGALDAQHSHSHQNGENGGEIILSDDFSRFNINGNNTNRSLNSYTASEEQETEQAGVRIPLPWELLQPLLRILGHCLLAPPPLITQEMKDAASVAVRRLYARASHDLNPQAILSTRSLVQLDNRARASAKAAAFSTASSNANTPKSKKPEVLLVSK